MRRDPSVPLTRNHHLLRWVEKMKELTRPANVHWVDGSQEENDELLEQMLRSGTLLRLNQETWPGCYYARSDASDVARVEQRTFVCSLSEDAAGPTNNWENPYEMRRKLKDLFNGAMQGRTMYVLPFSMGIVGSPMSQVGVQLTDSPYVVVSMRIMARTGLPVFEEIDRRRAARRAVHAQRRRAARAGAAGRAVAVQRRQVHRPLPGDARDLVLRLGLRRQRAARQEVLRSADRVEHRPRQPLDGRAHADPRHRGSARREDLHRRGISRARAARPTSRCSSRPKGLRDWKVTIVGDDIAWIKPDAEGRLRAINPETGVFGVAPGTSAYTNPNAMAMIAKNTIFTNVALTPDGGVWWEGHDGRAPGRVPGLAGPPVDAGDRASDGQAGRASERAVHRAARPESRSSTPASTTRTACRSARSCSAAGARRPCRSSIRRSTGPPACTSARRWARRRRRRPSGVSGRCAAIRWRCGRSAAITWATTSGTGSRCSGRCARRPRSST